LEYIPSRYIGLSQKQLQDRETVYAFKKGNLSESVKKLFLSKVREIVSGNSSDWVICFIPASTKFKTEIRYNNLASYLSRELGCPAYVDAIVKTTDSPSGHISGKSNNPTEDFVVKSEYLRKKRVILIDDVITRGKTFDDTADLIMSSGAVSVRGLFLSKTIHPNLPQLEKGARRSIPNDIFEEWSDDEMYNEQLAEDIGVYDEQLAEEQLKEDIGIYDNDDNELMYELGIIDGPEYDVRDFI
jgi:hypoxanthine-guanine phosphoribosyltransferase